MGNCRLVKGGGLGRARGKGCGLRILVASR